MLTNDYAVVTTLAVLAVISSFLIALAPIIDFVTHSKTATIHLINGIPYLFFIYEGLLWATYGISNDLVSVFVSDGFTLLVGIIYSIAWSLFLPPTDARIPLVITFTAVGLTLIITLIGVVFYSLFGNTDLQTTIFGYAALVGSILLDLSPFISMFMHKRMDQISLALAIAFFISGILWLLYGIVIDDLFILISSAVTVASGIVQIILATVSKCTRVKYIRLDTADTRVDKDPTVAKEFGTDGTYAVITSGHSTKAII